VGLTAAGVDSIWDEITSGHETTNTFGSMLKDINDSGGGGATAQQVWEYATRVLTANTNLNDPTAAATAAAVRDLLDPNITLILADTSELQTNQGNWITATGFATSGQVTTLQTTVDDINAVTAVLPDAGTLTSLARHTDANDALADYDPPTKAELDSAIDALPTAAENVAALMADTGFTEGGTWTFEQLLRFAAAWMLGDWYDKVGSTTTQQILDPDDDSTVILEIVPSDTSPYKTVNTNP
jgi:hypothetical protein